MDVSEKTSVLRSTLSPQAEAVATPVALKVYIWPSFAEKDEGDGGIRRVVEAQIKHLPKFGIEIVETAEEADVITYHAKCPPPYIKLYPRKTFVSTVHGWYWTPEYEWGNWSIKANEEVMEGIRVSDAVITCSDWVANSIRRHTSRKVDVIYHGIDSSEWNATEPRDYVLWNKTRPDPVCDPLPMNQVASLLPNVKFISTFGQEARNVILTGKLPFEDAKKLIQSAGVYLCTTRETFGIGTLEALACGVPVVGFNWGGQAEFIKHGTDGWLSNPGDIEDLAKGIQWTLDNRAKISANCRYKAEQFTWEKACEQYARIFKEAHAKKTEEGPRTSIIVTAYNLGQYLGSALGSVQQQSDSDWECIIVDDASPDDSGIIAEEMAARETRFKVIHNEKNQYLAEARNIGIRAASGRYILPLDADDMLAPDTVRTLADSLDTDRSIHVAYGGVYFVDEDGQTPTDFTEYLGKKSTPGRSPWPFPFVHEQQIKQQNLLPYASMFRKEAWEQTGGYRRRCRTAEDADMWARFSSYGFRPKMVTSEDTLIYRNRPDSMSRKEGSGDWIRWFPWSKLPEITPAGAVAKDQLPVPSLDPTIISIIIPVGPGHGKIVTDAIDSVDAQSFRNWEVILVNDTGGPLETELPSWVRVIHTKGKTGPAHARNRGIAVSKGRLFLPLDADDYLEPDALQFMFAAHRETRNVIFSDFWEDPIQGKRQIYKTKDYDASLLTKGCLHTVTALTPKTAWEAIGGYDESLFAWEDWDVQLKLADKGICSSRVAAPLFFYRKHTGFRREENYASFEKSKQGIISKWGELWNGEKKLMGCSACGRTRTIAPSSSSFRSMDLPKQVVPKEATLIRYKGAKQGAVPYKGHSRTVYFFGAGDVRYVLAEDVELFMRWPDEFEIVRAEASEEPIPQPEEPFLVAEGQSSQ